MVTKQELVNGYETEIKYNVTCLKTLVVGSAYSLSLQYWCGIDPSLSQSFSHS